jgi:hypothetical protein
MTEQDRPHFAALMTGWADYYRTPLSRTALDIYWNLLRQYDLEAVNQAMQRHASRPDKEGTFMPKASDLTVMLVGRSNDQAAQAWAKVDRAVRTVGTWDDVVFDDPLIHVVVAELGGWAWLGNQTDKEWPFVEKRFCAVYQGYRMRGEQPPHAGILTGIANAHNAASGQRRLPAVMIGDPVCCTRVARAGQALLALAPRMHLSLEAS